MMASENDHTIYCVACNISTLFTNYDRSEVTGVLLEWRLDALCIILM